MELLWTKKNVFCQENKSRQNAGKEMSSSTNVLFLDDDFPYDEICKYFIFIIGRNWHDKNQITTIISRPMKATKLSYFILQLGFLSILWTEKNATWLPKPVED